MPLPVTKKKKRFLDPKLDNLTIRAAHSGAFSSFSASCTEQPFDNTEECSRAVLVKVINKRYCLPMLYICFLSPNFWNAEVIVPSLY